MKYDVKPIAFLDNNIIGILRVSIIYKDVDDDSHDNTRIVQYYDHIWS
jgi:hypothetical protein